MGGIFGEGEYLRQINSVVFGVTALLLEPLFADSAGVVVLLMALHGADLPIRDQRAGNRDETENQKAHDFRSCGILHMDANRTTSGEELFAC
jgi:hypothetical protein